MVAVIPSEEQVIEWITSLSNWGRWGEEDQAGCLNLITPQKRKQAAALIHDGMMGKAWSLAHGTAFPMERKGF